MMLASVDEAVKKHGEQMVLVALTLLAQGSLRVDSNGQGQFAKVVRLNPGGGELGSRMQAIGCVVGEKMAAASERRPPSFTGQQKAARNVAEHNFGVAYDELAPGDMQKAQRRGKKIRAVERARAQAVPTAGAEPGDVNAAGEEYEEEVAARVPGDSLADASGEALGLGAATLKAKEDDSEKFKGLAGDSGEAPGEAALKVLEAEEDNSEELKCEDGAGSVPGEGARQRFSHLGGQRGLQRRPRGCARCFRRGAWRLCLGGAGRQSGL